MAYAVMGMEAVPGSGTRVWLLCRCCGFCFPANRISIDHWQGDDCPECAAGGDREALPSRMRYRRADA